MTLSTQRDIFALMLQNRAQEPFFQFHKNDVEKKNPQLSVSYTVWNSIENLEAAAYSYHKDIKNFWKWVKKTAPEHNDASALRQLLIDVAFFFHTDNQDELALWKSALIDKNFHYYPRCF